MLTPARAVPAAPAAGRAATTAARGAGRARRLLPAMVALAVLAAVADRVWGAGVLIVAAVAPAGAWALQARRRSRHDLERAYEALRVSEARFRSIVQNSPDVTILADGGGVIGYASPAAGPLTGRDPARLAGVALTELVVAEDRPAVARALTRIAASPAGGLRTELRTTDGQGLVRHLDTTVANRLDDPAVGALVLNIRDVTDRRRLEEQVAFLAFRDGLTGLPNRALLLERIREAAARATEDPERGLAVIVLDLDDFKAVNDGVGHAAGDRLLEAVARRIAGCLHPGQIVARLGGDEFVVLAEDLCGVDAACGLAERLVTVLARPFRLGAGLVPGGASAGVRFATGSDLHPERLLRDADLAMDAAKRDGRGAWALFDARMHDTTGVQLELRADLHRALRDGELVLHYQPIVDLATGSIAAFEALVRWQHPTRGLLAPQAFVDLAEQSDLIDALGDWVLSEATEACRRLRDAAGRPGLKVSVNVSPRQLEPGDVVQRTREALRRSGLPAANLVLEVTESVFVADSGAVIGQLTRLRELGVELALDDFGTGFSSLAYLERLPLDALKIDRSFVSAMAAGRSRGALVATIVQLAGALGLRTVAEGVETKEQLAALAALGAGGAQGFLFSEPVPEAEALALLVGPTPSRRPPPRAGRTRRSPARAA